jgi:hypothetical protein
MIRTVTALLLGLILLYGLMEAAPLLLGPSLAITSPKAFETFGDPVVTISGHVKRAAIFTLNGAPLLYDQQGNFSSTLTFPHGTSILTFVVADRFGRTITERRTIAIP